MAVLTVLGSGDAFFGGGRGSSCYLVEDAAGALLVDLGPTGPAALARIDVPVERIDALLLTHFHADHTGGVPYLLHAAERGGRTRPLVLAGPPGAGERVRALVAAIHPSLRVDGLPFPLRFQELAPGTMAEVAGRPVEVLAAVHHKPPLQALMLRIHTDGRVLAFTGDTGPAADLDALADGADLLLCECTEAGSGGGRHLSVAELREALPRLRARRVLLTHLGITARTAAAAAGMKMVDDFTRIDLH